MISNASPSNVPFRPIVNFVSFGAGRGPTFTTTWYSGPVKSICELHDGQTIDFDRPAFFRLSGEPHRGQLNSFTCNGMALSPSLPYPLITTSSNSRGSPVC